MRTNCLWKMLSLLLVTMGLVACSNDEGTLICGVLPPYGFCIEVLNADGVDLLNPNNEGNLCGNDWAVTLDGKAYVFDPVYLYKTNETTFTRHPWYAGTLDDGTPYYNTAKIEVDGKDVQDTDGKFREIVFDWGAGVEKDVFRIKISRVIGKGWVTEATLNGKPIDDSGKGLFTFVK